MIVNMSDSEGCPRHRTCSGQRIIPLLHRAYIDTLAMQFSYLHVKDVHRHETQCQATHQPASNTRAATMQMYMVHSSSVRTG